MARRCNVTRGGDLVGAVPIGYARVVIDPAKKHVDELLKLPPDERSEAAEVLLLSLEQEPEEDDDAGVAAAWAAEIERRIDENAPGIPAETVFAEGRARLQKRS